MKTRLIVLCLCLVLMLQGCGQVEVNTDTQDISDSSVIDIAADEVINLSKSTDNVISINSAGVYEITGEATDCRIKIDLSESEGAATDGSGEVTLILNNATWTNSEDTPLQIKSADLVTLVLADGSSNRIDDERASIYDGDDDVKRKAAIFSKCDMTIVGTGRLVINAGCKDGIRAINKDDYTGSLTIEGGDITISSPSGHGITVAEALTINGGNINITESSEGLQGKYITINDGILDINSDDDGINATDPSGETEYDKKEFKELKEKEMKEPPEPMGEKPEFGEMPMPMAMEPAEDCDLTINGGYIIINASGDGVDSNASITISGGDIVVSGSTNGGNSALDYATECTMMGGSLILTGNKGMAGSLSEESTVCMVAVTYNTVMAGTEIALVDSNDAEISSWVVPKDCSYIQVASSEIKTGEAYYFIINGEKIEALIV